MYYLNNIFEPNISSMILCEFNILIGIAIFIYELILTMKMNHFQRRERTRNGIEEDSRNRIINYNFLKIGGNCC